MIGFTLQSASTDLDQMRTKSVKRADTISRHATRLFVTKEALKNTPKKRTKNKSFPVFRKWKKKIDIIPMPGVEPGAARGPLEG